MIILAAAEPSLCQAVQYHRQDHHAASGNQSAADLHTVHGVQNLHSQAAGADHGTGHHHGHGHHQRLVHAGHDGRNRLRDLHLKERLPAGGAK